MPLIIRKKLIGILVKQAGRARVKNQELDSEVRINDKISKSILAEVLGTIQHTRYHLGQVISSRRALGLWPPK